jgi:hypothetical protein
MPDGRATEQPFFNPQDPAFHANPYPVYARMRAEDPLHWCALGAGFWAVTFARRIPVPASVWA